MIFLFATEMEAAPVRAALPHAQIVICGVGSAACAASTAHVIEQMRLSGESHRLLLAGIAGCYEVSQLTHGDVVEVVEEQIYSLPERFRERYTVAPITSLRAARSNSVNNSLEAAAIVGTPPHIENMEGAAFMAVCARAGVECTQIRAISNVVGEPFSQWQIGRALGALTEVVMTL